MMVKSTLKTRLLIIRELLYFSVDSFILCICLCICKLTLYSDIFVLKGIVLA